MRHIPATVDAASNRPLSPPRCLIDRMVDVRINVLDLRLDRTGNRYADHAPSFDAVLCAMHILKQYIDVLDPFLKISKGR